jgi:hypothetical protein
LTLLSAATIATTPTLSQIKESRFDLKQFSDNDFETLLTHAPGVIC